MGSTDLLGRLERRMRSVHTAYATREEDPHETYIHMVPISDNDSHPEKPAHVRKRNARRFDCWVWNGTWQRDAATGVTVELNIGLCASTEREVIPRTSRKKRPRSNVVPHSVVAVTEMQGRDKTQISGREEPNYGAKKQGVNESTYYRIVTSPTVPMARSKSFDEGRPPSSSSKDITFYMGYYCDAQPLVNHDGGRVLKNEQCPALGIGLGIIVRGRRVSQK
ncbi:hypothetical protein BC826DRAFT_969947 [Russula brevipes]|nr:hypothetical protein BC826DRAFT_969947 [Russula brevipes]